jgi:chemotaxis protein MotB
MQKSDPIIIVRKKGKGHGGHHGGAWKVAYADFVTAMMAFFLVMWLVNQTPQVKAAVGGYFRDPGIFDYEKSNSPIAGGTGAMDGALQALVPADVASAQAVLEAAASRIRERIGALPGFKDFADQVVVQVTPEGLRIELQEGRDDAFFDSGSAQLKPQTEQVLALIGKELATLPQGVIVEGHTDSRPYGRSGVYTNWELSADRANAARRAMEAAGLPGKQVQAVRGFADTQLRTPDTPFDPRNRRVSIVVPQTVAGQQGAKMPGQALGQGPDAAHGQTQGQPAAAAAGHERQGESAK